MRMFRLFLATAIVTAAVPAPRSRGEGKSAPVIPPNARYKGLTYGQWAARWWQAGYTTPIANEDHPFISGGAFGNDESVRFLAAPVGYVATIHVTIRPGTALFVPVLNYEASVFEPEPFHGDDEAELRALVNDYLDRSTGLFASIDGVPISNIASYREQTALFEWGPLPENNLFAFFGMDAPAGTTSPAVDAGVYLMIPPLSVGQHTIHVGGTAAPEFGASVDTTFIVTVTNAS